MWIVYKHTVKKTKKSYIGITKRGMEVRLNEHIKNNRFEKNLSTDDIESEILYTCDTRLEASSVEQFYIRFFDTVDKGYNFYDGNVGSVDTKIYGSPGKDNSRYSGITKNDIFKYFSNYLKTINFDEFSKKNFIKYAKSKNNKFPYNPFKTFRFPEFLYMESENNFYNFLVLYFNDKKIAMKYFENGKRNIGAFQKGYTPWNKGKKISKSTKNKMSLSHKGKPSYKRKIYNCIFCDKKVKGIYNIRQHYSSHNYKILKPDLIEYGYEDLNKLIYELDNTNEKEQLKYFKKIRDELSKSKRISE